MSRLVLASASTSRAAVLKAAGIDVTIDAAGIDENIIKTESQTAGRDAAACALLLAEAKGRAVTPRHPGALILGADQMLECAGVWFDKPIDRAAARAQLITLSGKQHDLISTAVILRDGKVLWRAVERPRLTMRSLSPEFLDDYMNAVGDRVLRSVGCYELESLGAQLFDRVEGDYFSILGLPLLPLMAFLRGEGVLSA